MKIYLDENYICHLVQNDDGTYLEYETDFFDDFAPEVIEGYRFVPMGHTWTNTNGVTFVGEMVTPWIISSKLKEMQWKYDKELCREYKNAVALYEEADAATILESKEKIAALEAENAAIREENAMLMECLLEMSEIVYA